jgi:Arm domain-containing DNA-binding protein
MIAARQPPNKIELTSLHLKRLKPRARPFLVWDIKQRGLAVQVHPSGRSAWKFIYSRHGRPRWFHIGRTDVVGLADARKLAAMMTVQVHAGGNPQAAPIATAATLALLASPPRLQVNGRRR